MAHDREVGGIRCLRVLELFSDYLDGDLDPATVSTIETHLRGCDWCEKFGGAFDEVVQNLRRQLMQPDPLPTDVADRLGRELDAKLSR